MERIQESLGNIHKCDLRENKKGITLVALVITIVILLILAGISISALTNTGLFGKAKEAKNASENAEKEQRETLGEYEKELDQYDENTLVYKVNNGTISIGAYVKYIPDTVTKDDENYRTLLSNLETYSGSKDNTESTLKQDELNWRVLDVKDGHVRLISDKQTTSPISLQGYNGYNNAVKLLDDTCSILYNNEELANKAQNLKMEDITKFLSEKREDDTNIYTINKKVRYPKILDQMQKVESMETDKLYSKQEEFINGSSTNNAISSKKNYWNKTINNEACFIEPQYYELFTKNSNDYWVSTRCININMDCENMYFHIAWIDNENIRGRFLCNSVGDELLNNSFFRPVITLNSNVQVTSGNGLESTPYNIK